MREVVIVSAVRTAIGTFGGSLRDVEVMDLGKVVIKRVLDGIGRRPIVPEEIKELRPSILRDIDKSPLEQKYMDWDESLPGLRIDEVIMGNVIQAGKVRIQAGKPAYGLEDPRK